MSIAWRGLCIGFLFYAELIVPGSPAAPLNAGEWPSYGRDPGGLRYSPLTQITPGNVQELKVAWTYRTGELETYQGTRAQEKAAFEATPIMVEGVLYLSTPTDRVIALQAASGKPLWMFDPKIRRGPNYSEVTSRGVAFWKDPTGSHRGRIFIGTIDGRLLALEAAEGVLCQDFGNQGAVDLLENVGLHEAGQYQVTSPPALLGEYVVVGSSIADNRGVKLERGIVRAYDVRTGLLRWSWDPIPRRAEDPGYASWQGPIAHETGAANAWAPISVDPQRDLVFVPTSSPSPDYYGGERLGQNFDANSVVALRGASGKRLWAFQTVHHDLWDYDLPMQPVLIDLERKGQPTPAVLIGTKSGHLFVLDRQTGQPLFPVQERPVPKSTVPGESAWPTQPFPVNLPVFGLRKVTPEDAWGLTAADQDDARKRIEALQSEGLFTPPSLRGSIQAPASVGGFQWGGLAYDPGRGLAIGPVNHIATVITLVRRDAPPSTGGIGQRLESEIVPMRDTPYILKRDYLLRRDKGLLPMTKPPWGTLAAVDLKTATLKWEVPLGYMLDPAQYPHAREWGSISLGGAMTTQSGLTFIAATLDNHLRAFATETGKLLWEAPLPASAQATPMTFAIGPSQYLVVCAGGHGKLGSKLGDYVIAYALPHP